MKYEAIYLPASTYDPSKKGFESEDAAWAYIKTTICEDCIKELTEKPDDAFAPCLAEWMVDEEE